MRKLTLIPIALMLLILTQCTKKNNVAVSSFIENAHITFTATNINDRTLFHHDDGSFTWSGTEYIYVGASGIGYLGKINNGGSGSTFTGSVNMPAQACTLYFIYLGNGNKDMTGVTTSKTIDFSNQSAAGTESTVTNYQIATASVAYNPGDVSFTATMETKIAIAHVDLSGFHNEVVYMHGDAIYSLATINFKTGAVTGTKGDISIGSGTDKYVAMIPQTTPTRTVVKFDSDTYSGQIDFLRGVQENMYYCKSVTEALPIATTAASTDPLPSGFSVSSTKTVRFSPGNLRYNYKTNHWSFAAHQYDYIGSYDQNGYQDLFSWGQNGKDETKMNDYTTYKKVNADLSITHGDWGQVVTGWRTLTQSEWNYIINLRAVTNRFAKATVCGIKGLLILPDDWDNSTTEVFACNNKEAEYDVNTITTDEDWMDYQTKGAVFLPLACFRQGTSIIHIVESQGVQREYARYWSATVAPNYAGKQCAYIMQFSSNLTNGGGSLTTGASGVRNEGASVRLVMDN